MEYIPGPLFDDDAARKELHDSVEEFLEQESGIEAPLSEYDRIEAAAFRELLASNLPDFYDAVKDRDDRYFLRLLRRKS